MAAKRRTLLIVGLQRDNITPDEAHELKESMRSIGVDAVFISGVSAMQTVTVEVPE